MSRAENRVELTRAIQETARRHLAEVGPAALSLRAIARDVGMVSSAVYRYFPSRDDLLTALIVEAYDELGDAVEQADAGVRRRTDLAKRFLAVSDAIHDWARANPHEYALLYGSPVTGYAAPQDTVPPAARVISRLVDIVVTARAAGDASPEPPPHAPPGFDTSFPEALAAIEEITGTVLDAPPELVGRLLMAWSSLFGVISFELWGHLVGAVGDHDAYFDGVAARLWHDLAGR